MTSGTTQPPHSIKQQQPSFPAKLGFLVGMGIFLLIFGGLSLWIAVFQLPTYFPCVWGSGPGLFDPRTIRVFLLGPGAMFFRGALGEFARTDYFGSMGSNFIQVAFLVILSGLPFGAIGGMLGFLRAKGRSFAEISPTLVLYLLISLFLYGFSGAYSFLCLSYGCWFPD